MNPTDTQDDFDAAQDRARRDHERREQAADDRGSEDPWLRGKDGTALFDTVMRKNMWGSNWRSLTESRPVDEA